MYKPFLIISALLAAVAGTAAAVYIFIDYALLVREYQRYVAAAHSGGDLRQVTLLAANQELRRINILTESIWFLLCALIFLVCVIALRYERPGPEDRGAHR